MNSRFIPDKSSKCGKSINSSIISIQQKLKANNIFTDFHCVEFKMQELSDEILTEIEQNKNKLYVVDCYDFCFQRILLK